MWSVYRRLAELWSKQTNITNLTKEEFDELKICLDAHTNLMRKIIDQENLSLVAYMVDDVDWQHEICCEIDRLHDKMIGLPYTDEKSKNKKK